jgi:Xaa-Pro dipeptidase
MNQKRINKVIEKMKERGIDQLIISDPSSIDYLINYKNNPGERMYVLLLSLTGKHTLFMNKLFYLDKQLDIDIVWFNDTDKYVEMLSKYIESNKVGVDKFWSAHFLLTLMSLTKNVEYVNGSECVDLVRMQKDEEEQALMIKASQINDLAVDKVIDLVALGKYSEKEVSEQLADIYRSLGAQDNSFTPIVAYGLNCADNHHEGDDTTIKPGDSVVIDMGCLYNGYCSDMTRTVFYKEVSDEQRRVYELVKKANEEAEKMIKPGVRLCDIDKCARDIIKEGGFVAEFNHRLGHFIGRNVHEYGDVSANFDLEVKEGMVFSIEPGVYIKGQFGVRIEDLVLVTKDGCKVLNDYSKELRVVG